MQLGSVLNALILEHGGLEFNSKQLASLYLHFLGASLVHFPMLEITISNKKNIFRRPEVLQALRTSECTRL